jgi:putative copper resistance protein D
MLVFRAIRSASSSWFAVMRAALLRFSRMGYCAVALVALTGIVNTAILVGSVRGLIETPYGRLLLMKMALFLLMVALAAINRFVLVPRINQDRKPMTGSMALMWTIGIEQVLGLAIIADVSILSTWPPAMHMHGH